MCKQSLDKLRHVEDEGIDSESFSDVIFQRFVTPLSDGHDVALLPGGADMDVTFDTRIEFCDSVLDARLYEAQQQCEAMLHGMSSMVPQRILTLLTWNELELFACGSKCVTRACAHKQCRCALLALSVAMIVVSTGILTSIFFDQRQSMVWVFHPDSGTFDTSGRPCAGSHPSGVRCSCVLCGVALDCRQRRRSGAMLGSHYIPATPPILILLTQWRILAFSRWSFQHTRLLPFATRSSCMRLHTARRSTSTQRRPLGRTARGMQRIAMMT